MRNPLKYGSIGSHHGELINIVKNPFRKSALRESYERAISIYDAKGKALITEIGTRGIGNSWSTRFWQGFDGLLAGKWTTSEKDTASYAYWRAGYDVGRAVRKLENNIKPQNNQSNDNTP